MQNLTSMGFQRVKQTQEREVQSPQSVGGKDEYAKEDAIET